MQCLSRKNDVVVFVPSEVKFVWHQSEFAFFGALTSVGALFYMLIGGYMSKNLQKREIDIIGVELMPGEPTICLGNGERGFECCCDECDYYLFCFSQFDPKSKEENIHMDKGHI